MPVISASPVGADETLSPQSRLQRIRGSCDAGVHGIRRRTAADWMLDRIRQFTASPECDGRQ